MLADEVAAGTPSPQPIATDYVLMTLPYPVEDRDSTRPSFSPPICIDGDLWIGEIDYALCQAILEACDPAGENFKPVRQSWCPYAFYRYNARIDLGFDEDGVLSKCIVLTRIVHPTSIGFLSAARVQYRPDGTRLKIIPANYPTSTTLFLNPSAFVIDPDDNLLIPGDLSALRDLLRALQVVALPERIESALWHHEAAWRHFFIDLRWTLLVTSLEALVKIKGEQLPSGRPAGSTKVFVDRLLAIGKLDATLAVPEKDLREIYDVRSLLAHGLGFGHLDDTRKPLYRTLERLVRGIIRKALLDSTFRNIFESDHNVAARLPLHII